MRLNLNKIQLKFKIPTTRPVKSPRDNRRQARQLTEANMSQIKVNVINLNQSGTAKTFLALQRRSPNFRQKRNIYIKQGRDDY